MTYLISLILVLLPTYLIRFSIFKVPTSVLEVLIYLVFIIGLIHAGKAGFRKLPRKIWLPLGIFIISLVISVFVAPDKHVSLGEFKGFFIDPILVFWLIWQFARKENVTKIFWGLILSGLFVAAYTILQKMMGNITADGRVVGIFGYSPNYVSLYLAPITVLTGCLAIKNLSARKFFFFTIYGVILIINLLAIYFSGSRGGLLAVCVGIALFVLAFLWSWIRHSLSAKIIISILIIMGCYTAWVYFQPDFSASPLTGGRVVTSNNLRWQIWQTSIELAKKHPILGVGLGNYQNAFGELTKNRANFPQYITPMALTTHNIFLMFLLSTGILGLISFLWLLVVFYLQAFKEFIRSEHKMIVFAVMTSILAYGLVEASIWKNDLNIIFWTFWGLIWIG